MERKGTRATVYNAGGFTLSELADNLQRQIDHCEETGGWADQILFQDSPTDDQGDGMRLALLVCRHARTAASDG